MSIAEYHQESRSCFVDTVFRHIGTGDDFLNRTLIAGALSSTIGRKELIKLN